MATLFDNVVQQSKVWRGASRVVYAPSGTSFPGKLESVIQPSTPNDPDATAYELGSAWSDIGGTSPSGVTVERTFEGADGVEIDQLMYRLFEGTPQRWTMRASFEARETSVDKLAIFWELPTTTSIGADAVGPDYSVAQTRGDFSAPTSVTERLLAFVQQHPDDDRLRVLVFRKAKLAPETMSMAMSSGDASQFPVAFVLHPDTDISNDEDMFGSVFEEDAS